MLVAYKELSSPNPLIRLSKIYETCLSSPGRCEEAGMASATEFRALARVERDPRKRVRLLAIANVQDGMTIEDAARTSGMGRATLYRWLARAHGRCGGAARPVALGPAAQARC